jgi:hypothetical protein
MKHFKGLGIFVLILGLILGFSACSNITAPAPEQLTKLTGSTWKSSESIGAVTTVITLNFTKTTVTIGQIQKTATQTIVSPERNYGYSYNTKQRTGKIDGEIFSINDTFRIMHFRERNYEIQP